MAALGPLTATRLSDPIFAIAWSASGQSIAVSHGGGDICIYDKSGDPATPWVKVATLEGHQQSVSGLDWSRQGDQILSCSHDRNAFVWSRGNGTSKAGAGASGGGGGGGGSGGGGGGGSWEKQMVITRLTKGALCVKWSPSEAKFAIGSAAKVVSVGFYDPSSKWWACKLIRKAHESSVTCVSWHPNSVVLATGSTDGRVRLFNAYVAGYEAEAPAGSLPPGSAFGECLVEVSHSGCGWVHGVAWAPGDMALLYASHDCALSSMRGPQAEVCARWGGGSGGVAAAATAAAGGGAAAGGELLQLPLRVLEVVGERLAVGAGWDGNLAVFTRRDIQSPWQLAAVLTAGGSGGGSGPSTLGRSPSPSPGGSLVRQQMAQLSLGAQQQQQQEQRQPSPLKGSFRDRGAGGRPAGPAPAHTACVTGLAVMPAAAAGGGGGGAGVGRLRPVVASVGLDGQILTWDLGPFA